MAPQPDVLVIGGGLVGCATALHLKLENPDATVDVFETDPTYEFAATPRASGGVRQLFTHPENIELSHYTLEVIRRWPEFAAVDGTPPTDLGWHPQGYLFIVGEEHLEILRANLAVQRRHGVRTEWYEAGELASAFPYLATDDLAGGVLSPDDGWLDPYAMLQGCRRKCEALGVRFVRDRVSALDVSDRRVSRVCLESGEHSRPRDVVNAAGTWAADIAAAVGMPMPIEPMRRFEYFVDSGCDLSSLPFIKDTRGLAIRPEGVGLSVGLVDFEHPGGADLSIDHEYFERAVWPALAHRVPALDRLRLKSTTVGLYDQNRFDGNPVIGNYKGRLENFWVACGFSGHGMMHAMGVGRALAERILYGRYLSIDLERLGYERIRNGQRLLEARIR
jgi:FAD-dependent oxidoreductase domain-containing protein 1